ncbi:peptide ABC transporter substrate-binding protein [Candidatus Uhrbacteria bacterium]|nr:peptide ABC transporter substrate-binding protein [Candidatus Uhrbacteria bacterium]
MSFFSPQFWRNRDTSHVTLDVQLAGSLSGKKNFSLRKLKYLHRILSRREYRLVQVLGIIVLINAVFLSGKAYQALTVEVPRSGGTYSEGLVGSPSAINPLFLLTNDSDRDLVGLVYSGLMHYTPDRKLVPDLAEGVKISDDQKEYTFILREGVTWHDGEPFTAQDVLFTMAKVQDTDIKSTLYASYKDITVKKTDSRTVVFTLQKPFAPFLDLATLPILPEHLWRELSNEQFPLSALNIKPVGTGPWKFRSLQKEKDGTIRSYTLSRNDTFYGEKPHIEKFIFKFYPDMQTAVQGLKNGHVQGVSFVPREFRETLSREGGLYSYSLSLPQYTALFINNEGKKELARAPVRSALALALDKEQLVLEGVAGEGSVIHSAIPEGLLGYHADIKKYPYDIKRAEELLDEAGLKKDEEGKRGLILELATVDTPERARIAEIIKEMWERMGITVALTYEPQGTMKELVLNPRKYDILLYGAVVGSDPDLYPFWHSSQANAPGLNLSKFANKEADALLENARVTADAPKRAELYRTFQDILAREMPAIFLYAPTHSMMMSKKIKGVSDHRRIAYPADRFSDSAKWYITSKRQWKR